MKNRIDGRVVSSVGGLFEVLVNEDGEERRLPCRARGSLRRDDARVLVGDRVVVGIEEEGNRGEIAILEALPRNNALIRPPLANLDEMYAVLAVADPAPMPETTDKLLAIMEHNHIHCTIVITKTDLSAEHAKSLEALYRSAGYEVFCVSAYEGKGIEALASHLRAAIAGGRTAAFAGASGVGKSSLLNTLFPSLSLETGEISKKIGRGKNTTRHTELYPVFGTAEGGFLADTPGFSMLDFVRFDFMSWQDLPHAFREFAPYLGTCRYSDCNHVKEEECAVRAAVEEGRIAPSRYETYKSLYTVLRAKNPYAGEK
ncbi:MAG: ribosome small subunit-dependent GTPase A [Clostridia bacterium]|nr:ribosome small subunit-dependent GTPase A [Clostridia bacterium]